MADMRGKYVKKLQVAHRDHKSDIAAWEELMNINLKQVQEEMMGALLVAHQKNQNLLSEIEVLKQELTKEEADRQTENEVL